jgi:hypothetical protein
MNVHWPAAAISGVENLTKSIAANCQEAELDNLELPIAATGHSHIHLGYRWEIYVA